jgi:hypothetical protein
MTRLLTARYDEQILSVYFITTFSLCKKVKVKLTLEQVTKAQRWSRGIALLFL